MPPFIFASTKNLHGKAVRLQKPFLHQPLFNEDIPFPFVFETPGAKRETALKLKYGHQYLCSNLSLALNCMKKTLATNLLRMSFKPASESLLSRAFRFERSKSFLHLSADLPFSPRRFRNKRGRHLKFAEQSFFGLGDQKFSASFGRFTVLPRAFWKQEGKEQKKGDIVTVRQKKKERHLKSLLSRVFGLRDQKSILASSADLLFCPERFGNKRERSSLNIKIFAPYCFSMQVFGRSKKKRRHRKSSEKKRKAE
ncbi:hypothetical protein CEXT_291291 [Caerostris extrusa]|uniref:Ribosomal protein S1 n=1 Tax=Caerostris extrusa TaxID=172846 RepID=A0AAV4WQC2_CAEEX|nr:hypothetical protein CEXT_291291 [Caerostris extrusa]